MPRRSVLTPAERRALVAIPATDDELIRHYTLDDADVTVIQQHRGGQNRLGFAVQLCSLRHPGNALPSDGTPPPALLAFVARQLRLDPALWSHYARRAETRREHLAALHAWLGLTPFSSPLASRARRSLPRRRQSTPSARRRRATWRLRRGSPRR